MRRGVECAISVGPLGFDTTKMNVIYLIAETTPPRLIVSLCSVNETIFARGNSRGSLGLRKFGGRGVKKNVRPGDDYRKN